MCGIVGYKGSKKCLPFIIDGLKRLEYRGYDSAGVAYQIGDTLACHKQPGSVTDLVNNCIDFETEAFVGMGHTRWATHGKPCGRNAHPHISVDGRLAIVHNGIIENYDTLKTELKDKGYFFRSDTDTEVLLYLIYDYLVDTTTDLREAVQLALERVVGAYAIVVMDNHKNNRNKLVLARKGSPLVVGLCKNNQDFYVASDAGALINYAEKVVYLDDNTVAEIDVKLNIYSMEGDRISKCNIKKLEHQWYDIEKGKYDHFMLKEIYEQPKCISNCLSGRIDGYRIQLGGLLNYENQFRNCNHLTIVACGSSWHAGLLAKYYIEEFCNIKVSVEYASEFRYRKPAISAQDIIVGISQSGETADTLSAIELANNKGALTLGICNVVDSSLARATRCGMYLRAGAEIGVASTKAFSNQVACLLLLSLWIDQVKGHHMIPEYRRALIDELKSIHVLIDQALGLNKDVEVLANKFKKSKHCLFLGRGYNFPIALEGALKLKEISYVHAEGYPAAEMKHGPIALIDKNMPVVVIANTQSNYDKIVNNIQEIRARSGKVITIYSGENYVGDYGIKVPSCIDALSVFISVVVTQLFAYHMAVLRGCNIDKPKNLAKSVTVE